MAKKRNRSKADRAAAERLEALRDVLDLLRSRVIEDDIDADQAESILQHLRKELATIDSEPDAASPHRNDDSELQ